MSYQTTGCPDVTEPQGGSLLILAAILLPIQPSPHETRSRVDNWTTAHRHRRPKQLPLCRRGFPLMQETWSHGFGRRSNRPSDPVLKKQTRRPSEAFRGCCG